MKKTHGSSSEDAKAYRQAGHYQEIRFNMLVEPTMKLLLEKIPVTKKFNKKVDIHGVANKKFGRWKRESSI